MACVVDRVKAKSFRGIVMPVIIAIFIVASLPAPGDVDPRLDEAEDDLTKASDDMISDTEQTDFLTSALNLVTAVPGAKIFHGHKGNAERAIEKALTDLKSNSSAEQIKQDISLAMREVQASAAILDEEHNQAAPSTSATDNPLGMDPSQPPVTPEQTALAANLARALVLITGDNGQGTGFIIRTPDGPMVVTNIHVIANNPNLKITTMTGGMVKMLSAKAASDRELALLAIEDPSYTYLDVSTDISKTVQMDDEVLTPGKSNGGALMVNTSRKIAGIGPEQIQFDNSIFHEYVGGPIFHPKSGKVLGVISEAMKAVDFDDLNSSFASRNSALGGSKSYYGLRLDTVTAWVPIDWERFQNESAFLDAFQQENLCLDSYLNGSSDDDPYAGNSASLYRRNAKIMKANDEYLEQSKGLDLPQRMESLQSLVFDLDRIGDDGVNQIQNPNNFYSFDEKRAQDELAYRKALKSELNSLRDDTDRLRQLPRSDD